MRFFLKRIFILSLICLLFNASQLYAQEEVPPDTAPVVVTGAKPPVMRSIFWNTVFGSAWGALMGSVAAISSPHGSPFRDSLLAGTTIGGILGYGFGVYLVIRGITFDPRTLPTPGTTPLGFAPFSPLNPIAQDNLLPFSAERRLAKKPATPIWQTTIFQTTF